MTFAEGFYTYFRQCPLFDRDNRLNFNFRGVTPSQYNIETPPAGPPIKQYLSGSCIKEKLIVISSLEAYGEDARIQIQSSGFYEQLEAWVNQQNRLKLYPKTPPGTTPIKLECLTDGYLIAAEEDAGWYQIQLKLTYLQGGIR